MSGSRRRLGRKIVVGVGAVTAGALPYFGGRAAWAEELTASASHEFNNGSATCTITVGSDFDTDSHFASAHTFAPDFDPGCGPDGQVFAHVTVTYTDVTGARERVSASGGREVHLNLNDVASDFSAQHSVHYVSCRCSSPAYTTVPK